jgi:hypothetical protein
VTDQIQTTEEIRPGESVTAFTMRRMRNEILEQAAQAILASNSEYITPRGAIRAAKIVREMKE